MPRLWNHSEGSVVWDAFDFTEQPKSLTIVSARIEHHQGSPAHDRLKVVEEVVGTDQRPDISNPGNEYQILFFRLCDVPKYLHQLLGLENSGKCFLKSRVPFLFLH